MSDLSAIERVVESSPAIVVLLSAACIMLWRRIERQDAEYRDLAKHVVEAIAENSAATHALTKAVDSLAARIDQAR